MARVPSSYYKDQFEDALRTNDIQNMKVIVGRLGYKPDYADALYGSYEITKW